jgi:hypothetical protein
LYAQEVSVAKAASITVDKLSSTVAAAVKAAVAKHPKVKVDPDGPLSLGYLIWGIPVPDDIAGGLTIREATAFAKDVTAGLGGAFTGVTLESAVLSRGGHLIIGIPVPPEVLINR